MGATAAAGVDVGASLAKIVFLEADGELRFQLEPAGAVDAVARAVAASGAGRVGVTGAGGARLAALLDGATPVSVTEFAAWGAGAHHLLARSGQDAEQRRLIVSLGTGTSVMLADGMTVQRIGGTALGGGTLVGLAAALLGVEAFEELVALATRGDRRRVDLLVSDIYRPGEIALAGDLTAANFGKLAGSDRDAADVAHALMGLVGENVALICAGLGGALGVRDFVFAGSTLRRNPPLVEILGNIARATGGRTTFLADGEFSGAVGALLLATS